jgi:hypothetical protein
LAADVNKPNCDLVRAPLFIASQSKKAYQVSRASGEPRQPDILLFVSLAKSSVNQRGLSAAMKRNPISRLAMALGLIKTLKSHAVRNIR